MILLHIARHQLRLLFKSPGIIALFIMGPLFLIFIFGQAFTSIFAMTNAGISAIDYFGTTLLTLTVFQGAFVAAWGVAKEKKANTNLRLAVSPVGKTQSLMGTFLGSWASLFLLSLTILALAILFLSVDYGDSFLVPVLMLGSESLLASALGISSAVIIGKEESAGGLLNSLVPVLVFLGGGYMIIPESGFLHDIAWISPVRWVNLAMLQPAGSDPRAYLLPAVGICAALSFILLGLTGLWVRRHQ